MSDRFLAVDVGGTRIKWALVEDGVVAEPNAEPVAPEGLVSQLVGIYGKATGGEGLPWGLCMPGLIDSNLGVVRYAANLDLRDAPVVALLKQHVPSPEVFVNDLVAAAVGEAQGETLALLQIGTGIAVRIAIDGSVVSGANGYAGEVGHLRFRVDGRPCPCGARGCVEAYGGWGGIGRRYREAGRECPTPERLLAEADKDAWAAEVIGDAFDAIGFAAAAVVAVVDPGTLRLGGGLAAAWGNTLVGAVTGELEKRLLPDLARGTDVESSKLRERASLAGLYALASSTLTRQTTPAVRQTDPPRVETGG